MTDRQLLTIQLERLRAILMQLEVVRTGARHDELLERARELVAAVRKTRAALARAGHRGGCVLDYDASASRRPVTIN